MSQSQNRKVTVVQSLDLKKNFIHENANQFTFDNGSQAFDECSQENFVGSQSEDVSSI